MRDRSSPAVVLVLDDEFLIAMELEAILAGAGYEVLSAVTVAEAAALIAGRPVDIAVVDFRMGDGINQLAGQLIAEGVPLLFCTGSLADEVHAVYPGARVLPKPFSGADLLAAVTACLDR